MIETSKGSAGAQAFGTVSPARVLEVDPEAARIQVMMSSAAEAGEGAAPSSAWATSAMPQLPDLTWGDTVLVAGDAEGDLYVIGVLSAASRGELVHRDGVRAELVREGEAERLVVYSAQGKRLFEYDGSEGRTRVDLPDGDVEFVAASGNIDFVSARQIRMTSRESIALRSVEGVEITGDRIEVNASKGRLRIDDAAFRGKAFSVSLDRLKTTITRSETVIGTLIERAKNSYRSVEGLSQTTAGRMRSLVDGMFQLRSKNTTLRSDEDVKIQGEKIHLG